MPWQTSRTTGLARDVLCRAAMVNGIFTGVNPLHDALDFHMQRHNVLATNLAHVDTPGFKPSDLARVDASGFPEVLDVLLERRDSGHMGHVREGRPGPAARSFEDLSAGAGPDGNYVSIDREAAKLAANQLRFDVVSAVVSAEIRQLIYAAGDAK